MKSPNTNDENKNNPQNIPDTGHEWDGIREYDAPMPRWWIILYVVAIVWGIGYLIYYPSMPNVNGLHGATIREDLNKELSTMNKAQEAALNKIAQMQPDAVLGDEKLKNFSTKAARSVFKDNCATCHGQYGEGVGQYPSLVDDAWIWGGSVNDIYQTIAHGVRQTNDDMTRNAMMPGFQGMIKDDEIKQVATYVLSWSNEKIKQNATDTDMTKGKELYDMNCAGCHGMEGEGMPMMGSPQLSDKVWLFAKPTVDGIVKQISAPKMGSMPSWSVQKLRDVNHRITTINMNDTMMKMLAVYVHSLGGGK